MSRDFSPIHRPPADGEYYVFRDNVHNLIEIEDAALGRYVRKLLKCKEMQRLRHIRQNGLNFFVYPSLESSRFPHSLGSFHVARRVIESLFDRQPSREEGFPAALEITKRDCKAFAIAALLHDIGHGPLSHVWEEVWAEPRNLSHFHEEVGVRILEDIDTEIGHFLATELMGDEEGVGKDALAFIKKQHRLTYLFPLLSGNLDVDRLDFMARDTRGAGVNYGFHDLDWIIRSLRFSRLPSGHTEQGSVQWIIAIDGRKGLNALVQFLHARENMYRLVYHHKTVRVATKMMELLFERAGVMAKLGNLKCSSNALSEALVADHLTAKQMVKLDDSDIWFSLKEWAESDSDGITRDLAQAIVDRSFYKAYILDEDTYKRLLDLDAPELNRMLAQKVSVRMGCTIDEAKYYYAFDNVSFNIVGRKPKNAIENVWVMETGSLGFEYRTLQEYWDKEVRERNSGTQHLLIVHRDVVADLSSLIERLSFRAKSAHAMELPTPPKGYKVLAPLGQEGVHKRVYVGVLSEPGSQSHNVVALKCYKSPKHLDENTRRDVTWPNLMLDGQHPNLASAMDLGEGEEETRWIQEELWTASLEDLLNMQGPRRDLVEILKIGSDLFAGLAFMHEKNIRHTDIKPDNCGIVNAQQAGQRYVLGDFGCMSIAPDSPPLDKLAGTLRTRAPEAVLNGEFSLKSDVWSLGATIYALCMACYPFVPFEHPHGQTPQERDEAKRQLGARVSGLHSTFMEGLSDSLPLVLSRVLKPCLDTLELRCSALEARDAFLGALHRLEAEHGEGQWDWQTAETLLGLMGTGKIKHGAGDDDARVANVRDLIRSGEERVPANLLSQLHGMIERSS